MRSVLLSVLLAGSLSHPAFSETPRPQVLETLSMLASTAPRLDVPSVEKITGSKLWGLSPTSRISIGRAETVFEEVRYSGTKVQWDGLLEIKIDPSVKPSMTKVRKQLGQPSSVESTHTYHPPTTGCIYHYKRPWGEMQMVSRFCDNLDIVVLETNTARKVREAEDAARLKRNADEAAKLEARKPPANISPSHVWDVLAQIEKAGSKITLQQFESIVNRKLVREDDGTTFGAASMITDPNAPYVDEFSRIEWRGDKGERPVLFLTLLDAVSISASDAVAKFGKPTQRRKVYDFPGGYQYIYTRGFGAIEMFFDPEEKHLRQINFDLTAAPVASAADPAEFWRVIDSLEKKKSKITSNDAAVITRMGPAKNWFNKVSFDPKGAIELRLAEDARVPFSEGREHFGKPNHIDKTAEVEPSSKK